MLWGAGHTRDGADIGPPQQADATVTSRPLAQPSENTRDSAAEPGSGGGCTQVTPAPFGAKRLPSRATQHPQPRQSLCSLGMAAVRLGRSAWADVPAGGVVKVLFTSDGNDNGVDCSGTSELRRPSGIVLDGYEYQRYQKGASPTWLPLRFPGQYHDRETDLFENWNRFYDPSIGRYLGPEPRAYEPAWLLEEAAAGRSVPVYAYARNNPLFWTDPDGLEAQNNGKEPVVVKLEKDEDGYVILPEGQTEHRDTDAVYTSDGKVQKNVSGTHVLVNPDGTTEVLTSTAKQAVGQAAVDMGGIPFVIDSPKDLTGNKVDEKFFERNKNFMTPDDARQIIEGAKRGMCVMPQSAGRFVVRPYR
jgi:RHS repeat-associated protein